MKLGKTAKKTAYVLKRRLNKALTKFNGIDGEIDFAIVSSAERLKKLCHAAVLCKKAGMDDEVEKLDEDIEKVKAGIEKLKQSKATYRARAATLEARIDAYEAIAEAGASGMDAEDACTAEIESYLNDLEVELETLVKMA